MYFVVSYPKTKLNSEPEVSSTPLFFSVWPVVWYPVPSSQSGWWSPYRLRYYFHEDFRPCWDHGVCPVSPAITTTSCGVHSSAKHMSADFSPILPAQHTVQGYPCDERSRGSHFWVHVRTGTSLCWDDPFWTSESLHIMF